MIPLNHEASAITEKDEERNESLTPESLFGAAIGTGTQSLDATANQMEQLCTEALESNAALETLLAIARPRLLRLVTVRMNTQLAGRLDAEDVVQESLATAAKRFEEFKSNRSVPVFVWLRGFAIERLIDANRKHLAAAKRSIGREISPRQWLDQSSIDLLKRWASDSKSPSQIVSDRQRGDDLRQAMEELPNNYREVLVLRFFESLSLAETAAAIGCTIQNAKVLQFRALKRLETTIAESLGWKSADRTV